MTYRCDGPNKSQDSRAGLSVDSERANLPITDDAAAAAPPVKKLRRFILGIGRDPIVLSIQRKQLRPHPFSPVNAD
jgi:hypothetical protein